MARIATATARNSRTVGIVHPASESRIERAASQLVALREQITQLEEEKKALAARLVTMVKREGEEDEKGKVRYETDQHRFVIVDGRHVSINGLKVRQKLLSLGITPKVADKALAAGTKQTDFQYVRVDARKVSDENEREKI